MDRSDSVRSPGSVQGLVDTAGGPWARPHTETQEARVDTTTTTSPDVTNALLTSAQDPRTTAGGPDSVATPVLLLDRQGSGLDGLPMLIPIPRAAALLGISRSAAYRCAVTGDLPVTHLGGRVYVVTAKLAALLDVS